MELRFCKDPSLPVEFIRRVECSAYQASECGEAYEQVLKMARNLSWRPSAKKVLILVGDDEPHTVHCRENTTRVDWREEMRGLVAEGVQIFAVQC